MGFFILRWFGVMLFIVFCFIYIVFFMMNFYFNLEKFVKM